MNEDELFNQLGIGEFDGGSLVLHETYQSFVRAGFNEEQAFELTKAIIVAHIQGSYLA